MLLRISLAALAVIGAAVAAEPLVTNRAVAGAEQSATPIAPAGPRQGVRAPQADATVQRATTSISCNNANGTITTYTLSVRGGTCLTGGSHGSGSTAGLASCASGANGDEASATCGRGCTKTAGEGSCTQTTN